MMGRFREENEEMLNQPHIFELFSGKKGNNFCEIGNFVNLENLHITPNLFSEIQRISSEIVVDHDIAPKVHEIRVGENYQAGIPNNRDNNKEGFAYEDDDDFEEGELVSYPNQKREREETEENDFDLDLSSLEDKIQSPKKKCCLHVPDISLGTHHFDLSDNNPGESVYQTFGSMETIFLCPFL